MKLKCFLETAPPRVSEGERVIRSNGCWSEFLDWLGTLVKDLGSF